MIMKIVHSMLLCSNKEVDFGKMEMVGDISVSELSIIQEVINGSDKSDVLQKSSSWLPR
ncbi:hypothetical protein [Lysinibacillus parviboronicapiens]|uniref:hypothetical protein n=2 Tax=Lysinibacillus parviboronicapiens TaxID=436516 RepID=UPI000B324EC9|nr:hypothetical protein [Lysinibacillus parviboronicapiens]